jgi:hypothetical protein
MRRSTAGVLAVGQPAVVTARTRKVSFLVRRRIHSHGQERTLAGGGSLASRRAPLDDSHISRDGLRPARYSANC